ncbi:MAG: endonuclease/exonuclease/phosphatase family protein [Clostridia bacterium]|nr:endonuclease/exonuclease/phosphatase family protein [Clostridia bacterium]
MNRIYTFFHAFAALLCIITLVCAAVLSVSADVGPVDVIHGRDIVLTFDYPNRTTGNKSVFMGYDSTEGVMSIWLKSDYTVTDADATTFDIHLGHSKSVDGAKYIALGLSYSADKSVSAKVLTEDTVLTSETVTLTDEITNIVFDASQAADGSVYDRISINSGYAAGEVITAGTTLKVKYIAFFDTKEAAEAYVYTKPEDKTYSYIEDNHIKSVSFNVLVSGHTLSAVDRSYYMAPVILGYDPDIIGLQEVNSTWYTYLKELFGDKYDNIIKWRAEDEHEATPIFWKKDKFELLDSGYFWLSETPDEQSTGWGATYYRICCFVKLKVKATGYEFYYFNTHWDFNEAAQIGSAELLLNKIENECEGLPAILSADFNMTWNSEGYALLDSYLTDANRDRDLQITYTGQKGLISGDTINGSTIDFVFYTGDSITSDNYTVIKDKIELDGNTYSLSDHYGVYNDIYLLGESREHTVTYTNTMAKTAPEPQTVIENIEFTLPKGAPVLGKRFLGWTTADTGETLLNGSYTAYSDIEFTAVYEDTDSYTITYMNGDEVYKTEEVESGASYTLITDVSDLVLEAGYYFVNWTDADSNTVESVDSVIEDHTFYAVIDEIVPLKEYYVMTPDDLTPNAGTGFTVTTVDSSYTDTSYFRYNVNTARTSNDYTRATIKTAKSDFFPAQFSLHDYRFMKVGYRSNISTVSSMGMNLWSVGNRIYGPDVSAVYDGNWQTHVYNLSTITKGESGATFNNSCDGPFKELFIKPYKSNGITMNVGDYFDIQYVAFFKTLAEADAYKYSYSLKYVLGGGSGGPESVTVFSDTEVSVGEEIPTK